MTGGVPYSVPFLMRLKEVDWRIIGHTAVTLNVFRNYQLVATVGSGTHSNLNLLFQPNQVGFFRTSSFVRLEFSWQLLTRWEIVSRSADRQLNPAEVLPNTAPAEPDTVEERIQEELSQPPEQLTQPVESHKTKHTLSLIHI